MKQIAAVSPPPPLPPKSRRAPPEAEEEPTVPSRRPVANASSSAAESARCSPEKHVVKIHINPTEPVLSITVNNSEEMIAPSAGMSEIFYYGMSSGQVSPSDTLDSGTCSDMDGTPPPLPKKKTTTGVSVTLIGHQTNNKSISSQELDSDNDSNISCDSLNSGSTDSKRASAYLPQGLLKDIRERSTKPSRLEEDIADIIDKPMVKKIPQKVRIDEDSYQSRKEQEKEIHEREILSKMLYDTDKFYKFHLNENVLEPEGDVEPKKKVDDESFAGYKDFLGCEGTKTIRSAKGTVRGVKNRVRAGIATFLQINSTEKSYKEKDGGKVVVYTTTMGIVRETYNACAKVKQILRTLLIKYEERDVFMSSDYQTEIKERMRLDQISVPQVFVDGQHIGDAEGIERLNESGELRRILKPYKSMDVCTTCKICGGYRLLPCPVCNGSKKSVHRNHFTTEFVALKCMNCDEVGLVKCTSC